jgi:nucleotide-binding universal stress UspA family protein
MPTSNAPFSRVLVPYDGSEPAQAALRLALNLARGGATLTVLTIVDEMPVTQAGNAQGRVVLDEAAARCRAAGIEPQLTLIHERVVTGILAAAATGQCDLIVMGTHTRTGIARAFLGSTAEGVLRSSSIPVLTVHPMDRIADPPFATSLVAIDDSEPADIATELAARLARLTGARIIACHAIDATGIADASVALSFGLVPAQLDETLRREAVSTVNGSLARAGLPESTPVVIIDGGSARAIVATAEDRRADAIIVGTHGRRGLRRFALGSVAESIVRTSSVPVLVVPAAQSSSSLR